MVVNVYPYTSLFYLEVQLRALLLVSFKFLFVVRLSLLSLCLVVGPYEVVGFPGGQAVLCCRL